MRILCGLSIVVLVLFNLASFNSYQARQDSTASLKQGGKVALIYASPTFHDEVVSSVACSIKDEGYIVIAYVGSGLHWGSLTLPFSDKRQRASESFYGKCVDKWVSITEWPPDAVFADTATGTLRYTHFPDHRCNLRLA